ncbi:hypothetical protein ACSBR1_011670 [Camellia fascicularis]
MVVLSCAYSAYPTHAVSLRAHRGFSPVRSTSPVSVSHTHHHHHHHHDHPFVPEVEKAVDSLYAEFRAVDNLVARNTARVLRAFQNARVGSHVRIINLKIICQLIFCFYLDTWVMNINKLLIVGRYLLIRLMNTGILWKCY